MGKPLFTYRIYCDACEGRELTRGIPQLKVTIEEIRKDHARWHERVEREAREKSEAAIAAASAPAGSGDGEAKA